jgi:transposase-like protein
MKPNKLTLKGLAHSKAKNEEARELLESLRWPNGVVCPRCESKDVVAVTANKDKEIRKGLYRCKECRRNKRSNQFTVTVGSIFEDSHIDLDIWLQAITLLCSSKKGMSAHQLHRQLGITYKTAWFMAHRIRYAMGQSKFTRRMKGTIEADETYVGGKSRRVGQQGGFENKTPVVSLVQRNGNIRSFVVPTVSASTLRQTLLENINPSSDLMTDELPTYRKIGKNFDSHQTVKHRHYEYVRGDVYTNTVEGFFSLLKRGINGVYHHVSKEHLHRYLAEFDFRYNHRKVEDHDRAISAIAGFTGKRLTYKDSLGQTHG